MDVRAPVNVASELYAGCLRAKAMTDGPATIEELKQPKLVNDYIEYVDDYCLTWMVIWYKPLMGQDITTMQADAVQRFDARRGAMLQGFANAYIGKR